MALFCALIGCLLFASAPALAAAPEAPITEAPLGVRPTSAFFFGLLNPGKASEGGTYEFLYRASKTQCEGGSTAPEAPAMSLGLEREEVVQEVTGLLPGTEYTDYFLHSGGRANTAGGDGGLSTDVPGHVGTLGAIHPLEVDSSGNPLFVAAPAGTVAGDHMYVLELPFGSFAPGQPAAPVTLTFQLDKTSVVTNLSSAAPGPA